MRIALTPFSQHLAPATLGAAVRAALGQPLRRAAPYTQLLACGAFQLLLPAERDMPFALLWQTTRGPREETLALLAEVCEGSGEPMPYDFLATQPAIAAAQLQPLLPGLAHAQCSPLAHATGADWQSLLTQAANWLVHGRYARVLCAHIDASPETCTAHWIKLHTAPLEIGAWHLHLSNNPSSDDAPGIADTPDLPAQLVSASAAKLALHSRHAPYRTVEFVRSQPAR
ncbi:MAG: hypothetical protein L6Q40_07995 [Azonexus sp.]|nr:hypothetical protein [Azonexus sp.]